MPPHSPSLMPPHSPSLMLPHPMPPVGYQCATERRSRRPVCTRIRGRGSRSGNPRPRFPGIRQTFRPQGTDVRRLRAGRIYCFHCRADDRLSLRQPADVVADAAAAADGPRASPRIGLPIDAISPQIVRAVLSSPRMAASASIAASTFAPCKPRSSAQVMASPRGASTISMQVTKNLFLWPSKSYMRKALEIPLTWRWN